MAKKNKSTHSTRLGLKPEVCSGLILSSFSLPRPEGRGLETVEVSSGYEGLQKGVRNLKAPSIEVWENQYPDKVYSINLDIPEFTCICPKTGLPDFAAITIEYSPHKYCIELKSFKMYSIFYRNIGIFHEHAINKILDDFVKACKPRWAKIIGEFNPRGGIKTTVFREYKK